MGIALVLMQNSKVIKERHACGLIMIERKKSIQKILLQQKFNAPDLALAMSF
jgi:hypothetical protein